MATNNEKPHLIFLTEEEIKAVANLCRVAVELGGDLPYITELETNGGKSGFDKLVGKIRELNGDTDRQ